MEEQIRNVIKNSIELHENLYGITDKIAAAAKMMNQCITAGGKIMFAGNGGSAADAQHLAAELVNRFLKQRKPLPGLALSTDTSILTAIGNDFSFDEVFSKQVEALGRQGDVFLGISTSGNSANIISAFEAAGRSGVSTIALTGAGGRMADMADCIIAVPSSITPRIQEAHILIGHILCEIIEEVQCPM
ncbi:MAG TPA: SIS domain-containing protein [Deltaproteobacteria bacterium]|nr:SIS domain-containing protein [Deltaproteobacteria bacterium]